MPNNTKQTIIEFMLFASKTTFALGLAFVLVILLTNFIPGLKNKSSQDTIPITAKAKREVKPDIVVVNLGLYLEGSDPVAMQDEASKVISSVKQKLVELGIDENKIKTENFNLQNRNFYYIETKEKPEYYLSANLKIEVMLDDFSSQNIVGAILNESQNLGINQLNGIYYDISNRDEILEELKLEAIEKAKAEKEKYEQTIGVKLGKITNIVTDNYQYPYPLMMERGVSDLSAELETKSNSNELEISTGLEELSYTVTIYYEIK
ncbi:MAG: hypothetical protein KatS3mg085_629 [Candidatus Dojkabacteria bacterium]|nr:MAG: hypothetical protein KatS3mg085_629 [Candidatus Dojkabacteria bacterium]